MKRTIAWVAAVVAAAAAPSIARAQVVPAPDAPVSSPLCGIHITGVTDELRARLEDELAAQGACNGSLVVRITTGSDGVVLVARDSLGRTRTRAVQSIDVIASLIASWVVDAEPAPAPVPVPVPDPAPAPAPTLAAPGTISAIVVPAPAPSRASRLSYAAGLYAPVAGSVYAPVRGRVELEYTPARWRWGIALEGWDRSGDPGYEGPQGGTTLMLDESRGLTILATARRAVVTSRAGTTQLVAGAGFGISFVDEGWFDPEMSRNLENVYDLGRAELSLAATQRFGAHWTGEARVTVGAPVFRVGMMAAEPYTFIYDGGLAALVRYQ